MKRLQVADIFWGDQIEIAEGPWNMFDKNYPDKTSPDQCKVRVQLSNGDETDAYYYADRAAWAALRHEPSYFWSVHTHQPIHNVQAWKLMYAKKEAI